MAKPVKTGLAHHGRDQRFEETRGGVGGICARCSRSFIAREDADPKTKDLCRTCAKTPDAPLAPKAVTATSAIADEARVVKVDPEHSWNKYVAKKVEEGVVAVAIETKTCDAPECDRPRNGGLGFCSTHYMRVKSAIEAGHGSRDDAAFVKRAAAGDFMQASGPRKASAPVAKKPKAKPPAAAPATNGVHRDVKPANIIAAAGEDLPEDVKLLLAIAELEPEARGRVARWAYGQWGGQ